MAQGRRRIDRRSAQAQAYRRLYKTARWLATRAQQLAAEPLCRMCTARGRVTAATICDHVDPRKKDDPETFFEGPFQSLCDDPAYRCHSRWKQQQEGKGYSGEINASGLPVDPDHPFNL